MSQFEDLILKHSWQVILLGFTVILIIGVLKYFKCFSKIKSSDIRKFIYVSLNIALSFGVGALYCLHIGFSNYIALVIELVPVVLIEYALYENFGIRKLFQLIGNFIVKVVAKKYVENEVNKIKESTDTKSA